MEIGFRGETGLPPMKKATSWQLHGLIFTTLYCVFMNAAPSAFGRPGRARAYALRRSAAGGTVVGWTAGCRSPASW